jgi:hypothetical protein
VSAIIKTLTLAIVLLIIGLVCVVIGVAGLVWTAGRDSRGEIRKTKTSISDEFSPLISARPRDGKGNATHRASRAGSNRDEAVSSRWAGNP